MYQVVEGRLSFLHIAREFAKSDLKIGQEKMHQKHFKTSTDLFSTQSTKKSTFSGSMSLDFSPTFFKIFASQFQSHGGANSYGYAYGSSSRGSNRNQYRQRQNEAEDDSQLKKLIREIRSSINETREFWTKLPYVLCKEDAAEAAKLRGGFARSRYERQFYKVSF